MSQSPGKRIKVVLLCWGSRGDVQPVVALALELKQLGASPTLLVNDHETMNHAEFVRSFSLEVETYPHIEPWDCEAMMNGEVEGPAPLDVDTSPEEQIIFGKVRRIRPDLVVFCNRQWLTAWALERLLSVCTVEFDFHREGSCTDMARERMKAMDHEAHRLSSVLRAKLEPDWNEVISRCWHRPFLYPVSPEVGLCKPGWPPADETSGVHLTGYWTLAEQHQRGNPFGALQKHELSKFLAGARDVVYMGWGSMSVVSAEFMVQLAVRTLKLLNCKGIILGSYIQLSAEALLGVPDSFELMAYASTNILWLHWAPHEQLMPRCQVIVQHGGCGTTAAALRAGRPTVVTPTAFDQFHWGDRVQELGVGVRTKHLAKLTPHEFAAAVRACQGEEVQKRAAELGRRLRAEEPGAVRAAKFLTDYVRNVVVPGHWAKPPLQPSSSSPSRTELPQGENLALRRPARASSSKSAEKHPSMAVDGRPWTRWTSAYADRQWLAVDLGAVLEVSLVVIDWEAAYARSYEVQGSLDGENWRTLASEQGREGCVWSRLKPGCRVRWLRMYGNTRATEYGFSIWEFSVYA